MTENDLSARKNGGAKHQVHLKLWQSATDLSRNSEEIQGIFGAEI